MTYPFTTEIDGRVYECKLDISYDHRLDDYHFEVDEPKRVAKGVRERIIENARNGGLDWHDVDARLTDMYESRNEDLGGDL